MEPPPEPTQKDHAGQTDTGKTNSGQTGGRTPVPLPLIGEVHLRVLGVAAVSLHGDTYFDLAAESDDGFHRLRLPSGLCAQSPSVGDHLKLTLLMGQPTAAGFV